MGTAGVAAAAARELRGLSSTDLVLVGENLWSERDGHWVIGGEQHLLRAVAEVARARGFRIWACQPHPVWSRWEGDGISWVGIPPGKRSGIKRWLWNYRLHRCLSRQARVVYSYSELASPYRVPGALVWQHGVGWDGRSPERQRRSRRQNLSVLDDCAAVVCVDTNFPNVLASATKNLARIHEKCVYIPNFPTARPTSAPVPPPGVPRIAYVRRFGKGRGTDLMTDVARRLWDEGLAFDLTLAGYSTDGKEEVRIRERLGPELASGRCQLGPVPHDRIHEVYAASHLAVVPTRSGEGTSLACLEAFAFGLPVVATWVGGLPNLVQQDLNGFLVAPEAEALTRSLRSLLTDASLRARLGKGALETAERFSHARWQREVTALFETIGWTVGETP